MHAWYSNNIYSCFYSHRQCDSNKTVASQPTQLFLIEAQARTYLTHFISSRFSTTYLQIRLRYHSTQKQFYSQTVLLKFYLQIGINYLANCLMILNILIYTLYCLYCNFIKLWKTCSHVMLTTCIVAQVYHTPME